MKNFYLLFLLVLGCANGNEQSCLCLTVEDTKAIDMERPISVVLDKEKKSCWNQNMVLIKKSGAQMEPVAYQVDLNEDNKIWFKHISESGVKTTYCFTNKKETTKTPLFQSKKEDGDLKLKFGGQSLIHYRYEMKLPVF